MVLYPCATSAKYWHVINLLQEGVRDSVELSQSFDVAECLKEAGHLQLWPVSKSSSRRVVAATVVNWLAILVAVCIVASRMRQAKTRAASARLDLTLAASWDIIAT